MVLPLILSQGVMKPLQPWGDENSTEDADVGGGSNVASGEGTMASAMEDGEEERETEGKTVSILSITVMTCILMVEL